MANKFKMYNFDYAEHEINELLLKFGIKMRELLLNEDNVKGIDINICNCDEDNKLYFKAKVKGINKYGFDTQHIFRALIDGRENYYNKEVVEEDW